MEPKDPYEILGVSRSATADDIRRAYRRLAMKHHPDRNRGDARAEQAFKQVQAAYEILGDPERRAAYDRFGAGGPAPAYESWSVGNDAGAEFDFRNFGDLNSVFEQFFRRASQGPRTRRGGTRAAPRGADVEHVIELTLEESIRGTTREVALRDGDNHTERIEFKVPPGVSDRQRIRLRERGQAGPGGRGDLLIICHVKPHATLRRDGLDLLLDVPVSFPEAALGARVEIHTLDGPALLTVPPGTSSGTRLRLRGQGVRDPRTGSAGDLYAIIRVTTPRQLSDRARALIEQLAEEIGVDAAARSRT